jgi:hypothetical protein
MSVSDGREIIDSCELRRLSKSVAAVLMLILDTKERESSEVLTLE